MTAIAAARRLIRATAGGARRRDEGFTLVAVVAVAAVVLLLAGTVITAAVRSDGAAGRDRGRAQALAAAEAGLDEALASLGEITPDTQASLCRPLNKQVWSSPGQSSVTVTPTFLTTGGPVPCGSVTRNTRVTAVEIISSADHAVGSVIAHRAIKGVITLGANSGDSSAVFPNGLFSDVSFQSSNGFTSNGGDVYSNGSFVCSNSSSFTGSIVAQGDVRVVNGCQVQGDVRSGGTWSCANDSKVLGSVSAAAGPVEMSNSCRVGGNVITSGLYTCSNDAFVGGDLSSAGPGNNAFSNSCRVRGSGSFAGTFTLNNSARIDGTLASFSLGRSQVSSGVEVGGKATLRGTVAGEGTVFRKGVDVGTPPTTPMPVVATAPPRQNMPVLRYVPAEWSSSTTLTARQWGALNAEANGAPTWSDARQPGSCRLDGAGYSLDGPLKAVGPSTVVDATGCPSLELNNVNIELSGDLTIFASDVKSSGTFTVKNVSSDQKTHNIRIIVPARGASDVCAVGGGNIEMSNRASIGAGINSFLYAPGSVRLSNEVTLNGAVYTCKAAFSNAVTINYKKSPLPPVPGGAGTGYTVASIAKVDVS